MGDFARPGPEGEAATGNNDRIYWRAQMSSWYQTQIELAARPRGFHLVTREIEQAVPELRGFRVGLAQLFLRHTSASLSLNENADPTVRQDFRDFFAHLTPDGHDYVHNLEGPDDLPAHLQSALLGCSLTLPVRAGRFALGTWQGVWLGEHRVHSGPRSLLVTVVGERND